MPLLIPNSFGSADGRVLREYNKNHEPGGSPRGGRFAPAPGGTSSRAGTSGKKIKKLELGGQVDTVGKKMGVPFDPKMVKRVMGRELTTAHLEQLAEDMLRDAEGVTFAVKVTTRYGVDFRTAMADADSRGEAVNWQDASILERFGRESVVVKFEGEDGDPDLRGSDDEPPANRPTSLTRVFFRDKAGKLVVDHSSFEKNRNLPAGFGKDVLRSHMQTYEQLGVDRIQTLANIDVGAYAWAKYGFASADPEGLGHDLESLAEKWHGRMVTERDFTTGKMSGRKAVPIDDSAAREMKRIARSPSKTKIWEFADMTIDGVKVGKTLLTDGDQGWDAFLNVKGTDAFSVKQRERFWGYVGRTKQPNPGGRPKTREAAVVLYEADRSAKPAGELCEWNGTRYNDRRIWDAMLNGDTAHFYELRDPAARATYRGQLPQG